MEGSNIDNNFEENINMDSSNNYGNNMVEQNNTGDSNAYNADDSFDSNNKKKNTIKYIIISIVGVIVLGVILFLLFGGKKREFLIAFDSSGGSSIASQTIAEGEKVIKPSDPTKENYNFVRWEYNNREYNFDTKVSSEMTLKAIWEEVKEEEKYYDIEFVVNGITKKLSLSKITEKDLEELGFEEKNGYEIKWYLNDQEFDFNEPLTENISLVGKYVKLTVYTVKFNSNGGPAVSSQKVKPNEMITEPDTITRYGFIFEGWYLNNVKFDFTTPITQNITLVAKWSEDPKVKRYEVTFDSDGGSKVDKQRIIENEKVKEPKAPTKDGYKFIGWLLDDKQYDFKTKVTKNITLKANWEKIIQYTVTFDKDNGSANETKKVNSGEKVSKPSNPSKTGYKFIGWIYEDKSFDFNTPITKNMTLKASYEALKQYKVTFDSNGGSSVASQTVYEGSKATKPSNPTKTDYDFVKWTLDGSEYKFDTVVTKDITLVAEWKEKVYSYKIIATRRDAYSPDSVLKLYRDNSEVSFKSIIVSGVTTDPHPYTNTAELIRKLNGATSIRVILTDDSQVTATIEFKQ